MKRCEMLQNRQLQKVNEAHVYKMSPDRVMNRIYEGANSTPPPQPNIVSHDPLFAE